MEILNKLASMSDIWEKLIVLLVGWLLGLLAPAIVDGMRRKRENKLGRTAILSELRDTSRILAVAVFAVKRREGSIDRAHLEWLRTFLAKCEPTPTNLDWLTNLDRQLAWTDEEIAQRFLSTMTEPGKGTMLQKYPVPLLDSRVAALWSFDTTFQRSLLDIRQRLHRLDDLVDRQRKLHDMTFTKLDPENRDAIDENIRETCSFYGDSAKRVVDLIAELTVPK